MKKIFFHGMFSHHIYGICFVTTMMTMQIVLPSAISNLTATPLEGGVLLEWEVPVDSNLFYVQIDYTHPVTGKRVNKNASVFCDTMLIEGMLAKRW